MREFEFAEHLSEDIMKIVVGLRGFCLGKIEFANVYPIYSPEFRIIVLFVDRVPHLVKCFLPDFWKLDGRRGYLT